MDLHHIGTIVHNIRTEVGKAVVGQEEAVELMLTDNFKHMHPFREMFMPYAFGVLYVLMAISYFLEA